MQEAIHRRIMVLEWLREKHGTLPEKLLKQKRAGDMVQVEKHLPSELEVLISNPSTAENPQSQSQLLHTEISKKYLIH
jgi:hypothetical protein